MNPLPYSGCHGDEDWSSPKEQAYIEEQCKAIADENIQDPVWWETAFDEDAIEREVANFLSRCMANLDRACKGELIALNAITTALSNLQQVAKQIAYDEAMEEQ